LRRALVAQKQQTRDLEKLLIAVLQEDRGFHLLPPADLRLHVGSVDAAANWWTQGRNSAARVLEIFGEAPGGLILDWGCGSGRTLHWLHAHPRWREAWRGCDVDASAIRWLASKGFADRVQVCAETPPLPYADASFSGLYSFSVLTHIHPDRHRLWYAELARVLQPGGRAHVTVQGDGPVLADGRRYHAAEIEACRRQGWLWAERPGHHKSAAVVSEAFTRAALDGVLEVERYTACGYARLDELILRKP
jgi:SAM-dependent methyltransferase